VTKVATLPDRELDKARWAIYGAFAFNGFSWGTFIPRIPDVKHAFELSNSQLGLALLAGSLGVLCGLKPGGYWCAKYGSRQVLLLATVYMSIALMLLGVLTSLSWFVFSLLFLGLATALQDISMNTHAATIEQTAGRSLMNGFHAWFSVGALAGGGCGALLTQVNVPTLIQMVVVGAIGLATVPWLHRVLLPALADRHEPVAEMESERGRPSIFMCLVCLAFWQQFVKDRLPIGERFCFETLGIRHPWFPVCRSFCSPLPWSFFASVAIG